MSKSVFKFDARTVVAIGVGAALYGVLGNFSFTIAPNTYVKPALALLTIFGAMFGPVVGFLTGFIGHAITDMVAGWGIWWGWVAYSGIMGLFMGLIYTYRDFSVKNGVSHKGHVFYMGLMGIVGILVGALFAGAFDIFLMNEPADKMYIQMGAAVLANVLVLVVLGIPAVHGLTQINKKNSNLKLDQ